MTTNLELTESAWQYACAKSNAERLAGLLEAERAEFTPETWQQYAQRIITGIGESYQEQINAERLALVSLLPPVALARVAKLATYPQAVQDQFAAQVDALPPASEA